MFVKSMSTIRGPRYLYNKLYINRSNLRMSLKYISNS